MPSTERNYNLLVNLGNSEPNNLTIFVYLYCFKSLKVVSTINENENEMMMKLKWKQELYQW